MRRKITTLKDRKIILEFVFFPRDFMAISRHRRKPKDDFNSKFNGKSQQLVWNHVIMKKATLHWMPDARFHLKSLFKESDRQSRVTEDYYCIGLSIFFLFKNKLVPNDSIKVVCFLSSIYNIFAQMFFDTRQPNDKKRGIHKKIVSVQLNTFYSWSQAWHD